ncbi:MAG: TIGR02757 family protein [Chitinophagales bacterium]
MDAGYLIEFLNKKVDEYNQPFFIKSDPILIPHLFSKKQDIEIAGFFAAIFSWGNRTTIIQKTKDLMERMNMSPYEFCRNPDQGGLKRLKAFRHRTFHEDDLLYFIEFFHHHYKTNDTLETAFGKWISLEDKNIENGLNGFRKYFFSLEHLKRTEKHISSPLQKSTCKRLNMFLRWMVRKDKNHVDFGIWNKISPSQLICPVDVHVARVARRLGLLKRKQTDWAAAIELTDSLKKIDAADPVKFDFALFGLGALEKFN